MKNQDLYKSAMDKITPSPEWEADTLKKLEQARKQMQSEPAAPKKNTVSFKKRTLLPLAAAAALALAAIPAARMLPHSGSELAMESAAADQALLPETAAATEGAPFALRSMPQDPELCANELISVAQTHPDPCPEADVERKACDAAPLPKITLYSDSAPGSSLYTQLSELEDCNPTWNLPAEQLPRELPVWAAQNSDVLAARMQRTADTLGLTLAMDEPQARPDQLSGRLLNKDGTLVWELSSQKNQLIFRAPGQSAQPSADPALIRQAVHSALETFAPLLNTETLAYSPAPDGFDFWFDPSLAEDSLEARLLDFSFRRMSVSVGETGEPDKITLSLDPDTSLLGRYPLKTLDEAKAELTQLLASPQDERAHLYYDFDTESEQSYPLTINDLVGWRLQYDEGSLCPDLLPVYEFSVKVPDEVARNVQKKQQTPDRQPGEEIHMVRTYRISAVSNEYCVPQQTHSN